MTKGIHNMAEKQSWRDECFKWVCRFANAQGGKLFNTMENVCVRKKGDVTFKWLKV